MSIPLVLPYLDQVVRVHPNFVRLLGFHLAELVQTFGLEAFSFLLRFQPNLGQSSPGLTNSRLNRPLNLKQLFFKSQGLGKRILALLRELSELLSVKRAEMRLAFAWRKG